MTWSAPIDRTRSTFVVLHTPVTCAPKALAICTANVPTPPDAPTISTCCPGRTRPASRSAWRAVSPRDPDDGCLIEGHARGLARELVLAGGRVLREGASADAEHLIADLEPAHIRAGRHDRARDVESGNRVLGPAQAEPHEANQIRLARHQVPRTAVEPGSGYPNEDLVVPHRGPVDLFDAEHVGGAVLGLDDRPHPLAPNRGRRCRVVGLDGRRAGVVAAMSCLLSVARAGSRALTVVRCSTTVAVRCKIVKENVPCRPNRPRRQGQSRVPLTRDRALSAAVALADAEGIGSLTMRKLARELGVEAMSLYHHVANKERHPRRHGRDRLR